MKQIPLKCGKQVTDSSQAVIYLFSQLCRNGHIPCVEWERDIAYFESMPSAYAADFFITPYLSACYCREVLARQK